METFDVCVDVSRAGDVWRCLEMCVDTWGYAELWADEWVWFEMSQMCVDVRKCV